MTYTFKITQTITTEMQVEADNEADAEYIARRRYENDDMYGVIYMDSWVEYENRGPGS